MKKIEHMALVPQSTLREGLIPEGGTWRKKSFQQATQRPIAAQDSSRGCRRSQTHGKQMIISNHVSGAEVWTFH
jgi:hypothetical protein